MADKVTVIGVVLLIVVLFSIPDWQATYDTFVKTLSYHVYGDYQK